MKKMTAALLVFLLFTTSLAVNPANAASPTTTALNLPLVKTYKAGEVLNFTVVINENVIVTGGTPSLMLDIGGTPREAFYKSGSSNTLQFSYRIQTGDNDVDGIQVVGPIQLNGATITNSTAEAADLGNGFGPSGASVLDTAIKIDTVIPSIVSVSYPTDKTYKVGESLSFTLTFSEKININNYYGKPYLSLNIGGTEVRAETVSSTNGLNQLEFIYNVEAGLEDLDGITIDNEVKMYGGVIEDAAHNLLHSVFPNGTVTALPGVQVSAGVYPLVTQIIPDDGYYNEGEILNFVFQYDQDVTVNGDPYLQLFFGTTEKQAKVVQASGTGNTVTFRYVVQSGDVALNGIRVGTAIQLNGGSITDLSLPTPTPMPLAVYKLALSDVRVDAVLPQVQFFNHTPTNRNYVTGESFEFGIRFTEPVQVSGTPSLSLMSGANSVAQAVYVSDVSDLPPTDLVFRYTVQDTDSDVIINALGLLNGTIVDVGGNASVASVVSPHAVDIILNSAAPKITRVEVPEAKTYFPGQELLFKVHFSEVVRAKLQPAILPITIGNNTVNALYAGGTRTQVLTFKYVLQASDLDADRITLGSSLLPNGGNLIGKDGAGLQADLTLNNVGNLSGIIIGQFAPQASHVSITGTAQVGSTLTGSYTYNDANLDEEGTSLFNWYRSDDALGTNKTAISVATSTYYNLQAADVGKYISFEVTPIAKTGTTTGSAVESGLTLAVTATVPASPTMVSATAGDGQATIAFTAPTIDGGSPITGYEVTASPGNIVKTGVGSPITVTGLTNGTSYTFTVKAINSAGSSESSAPSSAVSPASPPASPSTSSGSNTSNENSSSTATSVDVLVNGKVESAGTATTSKVNGQTVITVTVDQKKLEDKLAAEGLGATVIIPVKAESDIVVGELNGQMIKNMESKQAVLEIRTNLAAYTLPVQQINIGSISDQFGNSIALKDIKVRIEIAEPTAGTVKVVENAADKGTFTLVVPPIEFTIKAIHEGKTVVVSKFSAYVERTIAIPDGVDPKKITTGVVVEADGSVRHVPTQIVLIDGKYYAKVKSLTNSTYSLIWHPIEFSDVVNHWAKDAVNDLGSRMVIDGKGDGSFSPESDITRAEFVAILVRGLGLKPENEAAPFTDVKASDWYNGAINTAYSYHLVNGLKDGSFHPNAKITREEVMVITAKAMTITGLKAKLSGQSIDTILSPYADTEKASSWAQRGIADSIQSGIVTGKSGTKLAPNDYMTRAEVATIVKRLLQKSDLI
nr:S-layer homology domain-containing protein [Cohnella sp. WQ 127256]